jgi:Icc-related predicted phosphoesterase
MTFQIISDTHLEFYSSEKEIYKFLESIQTDADTLIIAGDFTVLNRAVKEIIFGKICTQYKNIIYILGNHEYYGCSKTVIDLRVRQLKNEYPNLHILQEDSVTIDGVKIGGTTLWFPEQPDNVLYENMLSDFRAIDGLQDWVYKKNSKAIDFIKGFDGDVLVTHHLPSQKSIHSKYKNSPINRFFVSDIESILIEKDIKLLVHGHTHDSFDYTLDNEAKTRIVCNPYGYSGYETNKKFNKKLIIEI